MDIHRKGGIIHKSIIRRNDRHKYFVTCQLVWQLLSHIPSVSISSDTGKDQVMIKGGKSGTRCSFVRLTSGSVLRLPGGVAGEKADLSWPGSLYLTLCIPIQLLSTHLYENTGHMCSCQRISACLYSFLFCTHLNVTLTGSQRGFLFVCSHLLHIVIRVMQTWQWGRGCNSWFFSCWFLCFNRVGWWWLIFELGLWWLIYVTWGLGAIISARPKVSPSPPLQHA